MPVDMRTGQGHVMLDEVEVLSKLAVFCHFFRFRSMGRAETNEDIQAMLSHNYVVFV